MLVRPAVEHLAEYVAALQRGWSPDNVRPAATNARHLARIAEDPAAFLASLDDPGAAGEPIALPDGSLVPRLPGFARWIWDAGFCGSVNVRWQPGTADLPAHVPGHIGYAVVPWRRGEGQAKRALALLLGEFAPLGLPWVDLTTDEDNQASIRVIEAQGGRLVERFVKDASMGGGAALRYRIDLVAVRSGQSPQQR